VDVRLAVTVATHALPYRQYVLLVLNLPVAGSLIQPLTLHEISLLLRNTCSNQGSYAAPLN
jgi:hypothetical protein